ncbi:MAG: DNA mismatch repair endonuclease MutL [Clostridiaceae bacterium]|nr:DNA mismatch repair endonuclease MutL [Clostridiaceae bacterium]
MTRIHLLDQQTANAIAAGEVVERPSSVVKELVENALDAGASVVTVAISQGGIREISVTDNGSGMDPEDARMAFGRHATSKLSRIEDLDAIGTMGFRGEALASIAAVAKITLETRPPELEEGTRIVIEGGEQLEPQPAGCPSGTRIVVRDLFYNVPARFKFLRKDTTEAGHVAELVERIALARPDVSFRLYHNQQELLHTPGNNDLLSAVYAVWGRQTAQACLPLEASQGPLQLSGFIGSPDIARGTRGQQCFYVNGRLVRSRAMTTALDEACKTHFMKGKYAVALLFLNMPAPLVDINVHPQKMEVRFWQDGDVFRLVYHAIRTALQGGAGIAGAEEEEEAKEEVTEANGEARAAETARPEPMPPMVQRQLPLRLADQPQPDAVRPPIAEPPAEPPDLAAPDKLTIGALAEARLAGTLFQTYLVMELGSDVLLIDQHAAHEKILFERLVARQRRFRQDGDRLTQDLLVPAVVAVSRRELQTIQDSEQQLSELGFACTALGPASVAVRSVPDTGDRALQPEAAFRLALAALQQDTMRAEDDIEEFFYQMACKAAVKAHDRLSDAEIHQLLADLQRLEDPYQCPHGRPVIVRLTRREIEKRFRRIV